MNDGILVVDEENNVTLINQAAGLIFNVTREGALGHSLVEVIRHFKMNELLEKTRESGMPQIDSFENTPEKTYIRCIATPLKEELPGSILFLMQDLTRIRQLEIIRPRLCQQCLSRVEDAPDLPEIDHRDPPGRYVRRSPASGQVPGSHERRDRQLKPNGGGTARTFAH